MIGDEAIPVSPASINLAGRTVSNGPKAASSAGVMLRAEPSPQGCADKAPTPFSDLLQAMIEAHAAENGRALQDFGATGRIDSMPKVARGSRRTETNAAPPAPNHRRHAPQLNVCVVGLIVAVGGAFYASEAGEKQPPAIAVYEAFQARSVIIGNASANDKPMESPLEAGEPGGSRTIGVGQERMGEGGIGAEGTSGELSHDRTVATPVASQPIEGIGPDTESRTGGLAERMPIEAAPTDSTAPAANVSAEAPSQDAVSPSPVSPEARSAIDPAKGPVASQVGQAISGVSMRAGPGNSQPVLATIPRGSAIEVIKCRQWCEVIFAGQRGWVYKTFIRAPLAGATVSPEGATPSTRKPGANSGVSGSTRTRASDPHRRKPAAVRLSTNQSARDAQSRSQSGSGLVLWDAVQYLWKQIRPSALFPN